MKTGFLSLCLLCAASMWSTLKAEGWTYDFLTLTDITEYADTYAPVATPMAFGSDGTIYQTGLYDDMVIIGSDILENIATSAFLTAMDPTTKTPKWAIGIKGAAHITQIVTDDSYIYIAGTYADEICFGSKNDETITISGTAESHEHVNTFVARYDTNGILKDAIPMVPVLDSKYTFEDKDLSVLPTALALYDGKLYMSVTYKGGYNIGSKTVYGTVQTAQSLTTCICLAVFAMPTSNLSGITGVLDVQGDKNSCNGGLGPNSICLTSTESSVEIGMFVTGTNKLKYNPWGKYTTESYSYTGEEEAGFLLLKMTADGNSVKQFPAGKSEFAYSYTRNRVSAMEVYDGNLYIAGNIATGLPMNTEIVPDLWSDQFAACLDMKEYTTEWASITGAKKADFTDINLKYREVIGAKYCAGVYGVIGSTNFYCDNDGLQTPFVPSIMMGSASDVCLGIACDEETMAVATKTTSGSELAVTSIQYVGVKDVPATTTKEVEAIYSVDGTPRPTIQKGMNIVKYSNGAVEKVMK